MNPDDALDAQLRRAFAEDLARTAPVSTAEAVMARIHRRRWLHRLTLAGAGLIGLAAALPSLLVLLREAAAPLTGSLLELGGPYWAAAWPSDAGAALLFPALLAALLLATEWSSA